MTVTATTAVGATKTPKAVNAPLGPSHDCAAPTATMGTLTAT